MQHIRDCCKTILEYAGDLSVEDFLNDKKTQDAVIRNFEIIGEAVKHLSMNFRAKYPNIE
ncbi:MAG: HepT-like ribonuclease domain-containing protein [Bacteroidota bacterium]